MPYNIINRLRAACGEDPGVYIRWRSCRSRRAVWPLFAQCSSRTPIHYMILLSSHNDSSTHVTRGVTVAVILTLVIVNSALRSLARVVERGVSRSSNNVTIYSKAEENGQLFRGKLQQTRFGDKPVIFWVIRPFWGQTSPILSNLSTKRNSAALKATISA